jgi:hypothetical protein
MLVEVTLVAVAFVRVTPWRDVVPVAVRLEVVSPPYNVRVAVATEPRFVTVRRVSDSVVAGQLVPLARQTDWPATVREFNKRDEPDADVNSRLVEVAFVKLALFTLNVPTVPLSVSVISVLVKSVNWRFPPLPIEITAVVSSMRMFESHPSRICTPNSEAAPGLMLPTLNPTTSPPVAPLALIAIPLTESPTSAEAGIVMFIALFVSPGASAAPTVIFKSTKLKLFDDAVFETAITFVPFPGVVEDTRTFESASVLNTRLPVPPVVKVRSPLDRVTNPSPYKVGVVPAINAPFV